MDEQLPVSVKVFRKDGKWYISLDAPRWFIDELSANGVTFNVTSSRFIGGGDSQSASGILIAVNPPPEPPEPPATDT